MIEFKTRTGNSYIYSSELNYVFPNIFDYIKNMVMFIDNNGLSEKTLNAIKKYKNNPYMDLIYYIYYLNKDNLTKDKTCLITNFSTKYFIKYLRRNGFFELTLEVTQDCNLRCKYCYFSENYQLTRNYTKKKMSWEIAKKALKMYYGYLNDSRIYNPVRKATIGFYGGEPLLNYNLIKKCVNYVKREYSNIETLFTITTNGTILSKEKLDFFKKNNFNIIVSLDGDKKNHNRNRVYANGKGSFDEVIHNIKELYRHNIETFSIVTYDWKTNLIEVSKFYERDDIPLPLFINPVSIDQNCNYYSRFDNRDRENYISMIYQLKEEWYRKLSGNKHINEKISVIELFMLSNILKIHSQINNIIFLKPEFMPYTGACIPGTKIFVDVEGKCHICEKINPSLPIGDVEDGLDFDMIQSIIEKYNSQITIKCDNCTIKRICSLCYPQFLGNNQFVYNTDICKIHRAGIKESLEDYFSTLEIYPKIDKLLDNVFGNISDEIKVKSI